MSFFELDDAWGIAEALEAIAALLATRGDAADAATVAGGASALRNTIAAAPFPTDRAVLDAALAEARATIGDAAWEAAWEAGVRADATTIVERAMAVLLRAEDNAGA